MFGLRKRFVGTNAGRGETRARGFTRSEEGSLIIFGLFIFVMILTVGGMGVDLMRYETERVRLQSTLDRAVLAAASMSQPLEPEDVVLDYFDRAGLGDYIERDDITATNNVVARSVEASVTMDVPSMFLKFVGIDNLVAPAAGMAAQSAGKAEISLVVDISGSMGGWSETGGDTKLNILKDAATQFVNIVLCDPSDPTKTTDCIVPEGQISMSLVPYAHEVSIGPDLAAAFKVTDEHSESACVDFQDEDFETTAISDETVLQRAGYYDRWSDWDESANPRTYDCRTDTMREVLAIQDDAGDLRDRIDDLWAGGNTSIDIGMKWGTALLDPAMQPVVQTLHDDGYINAGLMDRPFGWDEGQVQKVVVLMTDGQNTSYRHLREGFYDGLSPIWRSDSGVYSIYKASTDQYYWESDEDWHDHPFGQGEVEQCTWVKKKVKYKKWNRKKKKWVWKTKKKWVEECETVTEDTGVTRLTYPELWTLKPTDWYDSFSWLSDPITSEGGTTKNSRLDDICTAAKDAGMTIFTVGFETSDWSGNILRQCATSD
ncbi:MAG TPA: hypothetical protein ENK63_05125, partial [Rhodobacterales bacterium]|nr:hypothetical protein [Rhodobacterales bacterium]